MGYHMVLYSGRDQVCGVSATNKKKKSKKTYLNYVYDNNCGVDGVPWYTMV